MTKWTYGDAWEHFPIEPGETWVIGGDSRVAVHDLFLPLPGFMLRADLLFVDPPWNRGNLNSFYTKAEKGYHIDHFSEFETALFQRVADVNPLVCYLEVGNQANDRWVEMMHGQFPYVQHWNVVYYRKHPCNIIRGSHIGALDFDYTGMDEARVIKKIAEIERSNCIGDFCMGRGLVGLAAYAAGKPFVGTELNKRRLAVLLQKLAAKGADVYSLSKP